MTRRERLVRQIRHRKRAAQRAAQLGHGDRANAHRLAVAELRRKLAEIGR